MHHADKLRFKSHHMVYTVPTYLLFTAPGALPYDGRVRPVPIPHVRNRAGQLDQEANQSVDELIDVITRRIPWERLLGDREILDRVIAASGGHLRDLFLILHEVITQVYGRRLELPVDARQLEEAPDSMGAQLLQRDQGAGGLPAAGHGRRWCHRAQRGRGTHDGQAHGHAHAAGPSEQV